MIIEIDTTLAIMISLICAGTPNQNITILSRDTAGSSCPK